MSRGVAEVGAGAFGHLLLHYRRRAGLTQEALAGHAQLSPRAISDLERGLRRYPRRETVRLLSEAMKLSPEERAALQAAAVRPMRPATITLPSHRDVAVAEPISTRLTAFIGRQRELASLSGRLARTKEGEGGAFLLTGEPGIGKTRLLNEFRRLAQASGWVVLSGRAYEMEAMPPYLPFAEALRGHFRASGDVASLAALVTEAPEIASLVPELRDTLAHLPAKLSLGAETDRYRLFESVSDIFQAIATAPGRRGLVLCVDDLHWADASTLLLLEHVVRRLAGMPFLLVATYRDFDPNLQQRLVPTLDRLLRERLSQSMDLPRLSETEVRMMLAELAGTTPPDELVLAVYSETEGNPLFVEEVYQFLSQEGLLFDASGSWLSGTTSLQSDVPSGVRLVIERRLAQASEDCRRILVTAAVIGRTFSPELLRELAAMEEDAFYCGLEEAHRTRVLAPASSSAGQLSFTHDLIRQTLLGGLSAARRQRLHERVAEAIETLYKGDLEPHLADLATHYLLVRTRETLHKAIDYAEQAARQALQACAYTEAAALYDQALAALEQLAPGEKSRRCDLLIALVEALNYAGTPRVPLERSAPEALALAEALGDRTRARRICDLVVDSFHAAYANLGWERPEGAFWADAADRSAEDGTISRVIADVALGRVRCLTGRPEEGRRFLRRATQLAQELDDNSAIWFAGMHWLETLGEILFAAGRDPTADKAGLRAEFLAAATDLTGRPREGISTLRLRVAFFFIAFAYPGAGRRHEAEAIVAEMQALADYSRQPQMELMTGFYRVLLFLMDGRLDEASDEFASLSERAHRLDLGQMLRIFGGAGIRLLQYLGGEPRDEQGLLPAPRNAFLPSGDRVESRRIVEQAMKQDLRELSPGFLLTLLDAAVIAGHQNAAEKLLRLQETAGFLAYPLYPTVVDRVLGDAAALVGRREEARRYYERGLQVTKRMRFRPEEALIHLGLARLLLTEDSAKRRLGLRHLDFAIEALEDMKMKPALERALRQRQRSA